ncbi:MAG TPA: universal stress protein [Acidimicrobiales bacterium]
MFDTIIVPLDGSEAAERALPPAREIATTNQARLVVFHADQWEDLSHCREELRRRFVVLGVDVDEIVTDGSVVVADGLVGLAGRVERPLICMATHGNGGLARLIGTTTQDLLARWTGPVLAVGPHGEQSIPFAASNLLMTVDGSEASEVIATDAVEWSETFGAVPWVVTALAQTPPVGPGPGVGTDTLESSYVHRVAENVQTVAQRFGDGELAAEYEVLHGNDPAEAIVAFARSLPASVIAMSTHGRTGLARIAVGSVALRVVRDAPCPVLIRRPDPSLLDARILHDNDDDQTTTRPATSSS